MSRYINFINYNLTYNEKDEDYLLQINLDKFCKVLNSKGIISNSDRFEDIYKRREFEGKVTCHIHICNEDVEMNENSELFVEDMVVKHQTNHIFIGVNLLDKTIFKIDFNKQNKKITIDEFTDIVSKHKFIQIYLTKEIILGKDFGKRIYNLISKIK